MSLSGERSVVAKVFLFLFLVIVWLSSAFCSSLSLHVLYHLVKETSSGNGAKYRYWIQLIVRDVLCLFLDTLVNMVALGAAVGLLEGGAGEPVCWVTGYLHVTLTLLSPALLCALQLHQYLAVVVFPSEHPKFRQNLATWLVSWISPILICAAIPLTGATDIRFAYNRMGCTFYKEGRFNNDTSLLILIATSLGFTCAFCAIVSLKVHSALKEDDVLAREAKHVSLFGDRLVKESKREEVTTGETHRTDFHLTSLITLTHILLLLPYTILLFCASANSGKVGREWEELVILSLKITPIANFALLTRNLVFRCRLISVLKSIDYKLRCFHLRRFLRAGRATKVLPHST